LARGRRDATLGLDPDRLCIAVYSSGGPLASVFMRERAPHVRCLVLFYPFLDLEHMRSQSPFRPAHPAAHVDSLVPRYSPTHLLAVAPSELPPIFLAMAGEDQIPRLNGSIERFMNAVVATVWSSTSRFTGVARTDSISAITTRAPSRYSSE
jgi:acetyl esterase/lipase